MAIRAEASVKTIIANESGAFPEKERKAVFQKKEEKMMSANFTWWYTDARVDDDFVNPFSKIIFLDIDGVLNTAPYVETEEQKVERSKVQLLKSIVDQTGADIILSSSWKWGYRDFVENGYKHKDAAYRLLYDRLAEVGLEIKGIIPISQESGVDKCPLEIREWLSRYHDIFSYVILDDSVSYSWGFLQRNVVTTLTYHPDAKPLYRFQSGLTEEHVRKAVSILNEKGAYNVDDVR